MKFEKTAARKCLIIFNAMQSTEYNLCMYAQKER